MLAGDVTIEVEKQALAQVRPLSLTAAMSALLALN
jgi:hypothetical protein